MNRLRLALLAAVVAGGFASAQISTTPGTPEQVNRAIAEAPGTWADEAIELLVSRGIYIGDPDGSFRWRDDITRAEMAMVIARLIRTFDLDAFSPDELTILRRAAEDLAAELAGLQLIVAEHDGELAGVAAALDSHELALTELWAAVRTLDSAPEVFDATGLERDLAALAAAVAALEAEAADLRNRSADLENREAPDTAPLLTRLAELEAQAASKAERQADLESRLAELETRTAALGTSVASQAEHIILLQLRLDTAEAELAALSGRTAAVEEELRSASATLADHEERLARLEEALLPERAPFYLSAALFGSAPDGGLVGLVAVGHDSVLGNLGVRAAVDFGFSEVPISLSGGVTYRATLDAADGYAGLGLGVSFEESGNALFGELLLGVSWRFAKHFGLFLEGRYRPYFDGSGDGLAALGGGIQLRF